KETMEIVKVTKFHQDYQYVDCERAQEGTTAQDHEVGSLVENNFTAGTYQALVDEINRSIRVVDSEIGDDYILKKYSDGTFELVGHHKIDVTLTNEIKELYRTGNLIIEFEPIQSSDYEMLSFNATIMNGQTNMFLAMSANDNPLSLKAMRYRIMRPGTSMTEDEVEVMIGYSVFGTWK